MDNFYTRKTAAIKEELDAIDAMMALHKANMALTEPKTDALKPFEKAWLETQRKNWPVYSNHC
jgi:hypothetical protein